MLALEASRQRGLAEFATQKRCPAESWRRNRSFLEGMEVEDVERQFDPAMRDLLCRRFTAPIDTSRPQSTLNTLSSMDESGPVALETAVCLSVSEPLGGHWLRPEQILSALSEPIQVVDEAGIIVWANEAAAQVLGWALADMLGKEQHALVHPCHSDETGCERDRCILQATLADGEVRRATDEVWRRKDMSTLQVDYVSAPIRVGEKVAGAVFVFRTGLQSRRARESAFPHDSISQSIFESGPDGTFHATPDGRFLTANRALAEMYGYRSPDDLIASITRFDDQLFVEAKRREEFLRMMRENGGVSAFEAQVCRRDGTTTWISENVHVVRDEAGKPLRCEGTVRDITWRKLAEEVLRQTEEKWRALVESSGESIVIADGSGTIFFANGNAQKSTLGLPGANIFGEFTTPSQTALREAMDRAFRTRRAEALGLERVLPLGASSWFEVRVVPIEQAGSVERAILIATDVTAKRQAEEVVRESQRFIGRVADASPAILYVYDVVQERCVYVNHRVERILGYPPEVILSGSMLFTDELVHPEDAGLLLERRRRLADAAEDGIVFECTFRLRHSHGRWLWIRTRDVVFTRAADGRPEQIIGMAEDVTERHRARQDLEHSREQLRALSARLQEAREEERAAISRRVHDELGQALTALNWEIAWLKDRLTPKARGGQAEVLEKLAGMSGMVDAMMLTVRKVAAELRPPILDHFGLVAAIEWQAKEFQSRYRTVCEVIAREGISTPDRDVSTGVFRIFQEILTNIARHAGATKVRVHLNENAEGLALVVSDNGRGITEGQKSQSLGILGMSERAHLFGGTVEIAGIPGKGTTVTVLIPQMSAILPGTPKKETLRMLH